MAKNLKLNVKNAQLAEALKLGQIKKPSAKKKAEKEEPVAHQVAATSDQAAPAQEKKKRAASSKTKSTTESAPLPSPSEIQQPRETGPKEIPAAVTALPPSPPVQERIAPPSSETPTSTKSPNETPTQTPERDTVAATEQRWRQDTTRPAYPPRSSTPPPSPRAPYQGNSSYPPRTPQSSGYPPRSPSSSGYPSRSSGPGNYSSQQPSSGGYPSRSSGPGNYSSQQPSSGGYPPRSSGPGNYSSQQPSSSGYPPRSSGPGNYSSQQPSSGSYPPRSSGPGNYSSQQPSGSGYPPRRPPYSTGGAQSGAQRPGGYPPRSNYPGGDQRPPYRPVGSTGGYPPRRPGEYTPGGMRPPGGASGPYRPRSPYPSSGGPGGAPRPGGYAGGGFRPASPGGYGARPPFTPRGPMPTEETKGGDRKRIFETEPRKAPPKDFREHKPSSGKKMEERSFDARDRYGLRNTEDEAWRKRRPANKMRSMAQQEELRPKTLHVRIPITIKDLAVEMKLKASQLIAKLFMKGVIVTINDFLDDETTIQLLGHDFDCAITIDRSEEERLQITDKTIKQEISETPAESLLLRSPVVAFMGHVDHGKTSLIDAIRASDIAGDEAGAITQHIGAFTCHTPAGNITILDTPGHEAFSAMRARGADVTDIVVLVIAGDEGMRTQTLEALEQARTAKVPIVVAINKCDKPNFNPETIYRQLADQNLLPEAWGGQTITINCSALTKQGIPELLEMLALQAEVLELRANPESRARGTVIESQMHKGLGAVATILVQNGTLHLGDSLVFGHEFAKVKTMHNEHDRPLQSAGPSTPVKITGLSGLPSAGSEFIVVKNEKEASEITEKRSEGHRHTILHQAKRGVESVLAAKAANVKKKVLNLIVRADVQGSVEAIKTSLLKITSEKIDLNILSAAVGEISESDVQLASTSKAVILGFHTKVESHAESLIRSLSVSVRLHDIIYHAVDDIRALMLTMLDKVAQENAIGSAEVKAVFKASQLGLIAGCIVTDGMIKRSSHVKQIRDKQVIWKGPIQSLKKVKEDVREVSKGHECGIVLSGQGDVRIGDIFEAFEVTYLQQEL